MRFRLLNVPPRGDGMRLDELLQRMFRDLPAELLGKGIRSGQVRCRGRVLRPSTRVQAADPLEISIPILAPHGDPPPLPPVLHEADGLVVIDKPAGMLSHPAGSAFTWALIGLARERWPEVELVHRLDRDTSGCLALTTDPALNRTLKMALERGEMHKSYVALCKGEIPWDRRILDGPIGPDGGSIRIKMRVRDDGRPACTEVEVLGRAHGLTKVRCTLITGRKHQIRVHLAHAGHGLLGDRMYGVEPEVFLHSLEHGADEAVVRAAGAPRQALHAAELTVPHPGGPVRVTSEMPADMAAWWEGQDATRYAAP